MLFPLIVQIICLLIFTVIDMKPRTERLNYVCSIRETVYKQHSTKMVSLHHSHIRRTMPKFDENATWPTYDNRDHISIPLSSKGIDFPDLTNSNVLIISSRIQSGFPHSTTARVVLQDIACLVVNKRAVAYTQRNNKKGGEKAIAWIIQRACVAICPQ